MLKVPCRVGVLSLVMPPSAIVPRIRSTLSLMVVITTAWVGATVSRVKVRAGEIGPRLPAVSITWAVIEVTALAVSGVEGVNVQVQLVP